MKHTTVDYAQLLCNGQQSNPKTIQFIRAYECGRFFLPVYPPDAHYNNYTEVDRQFNVACNWWLIGDMLLGHSEFNMGMTEEQHWYAIPLQAYQHHLGTQLSSKEETERTS